MRLWSIHPRYLDTAGLVALWRESLLARTVLRGNTRGYKNHPQLLRFRNCRDPVKAIERYLSGVYAESLKREFKFDHSKLSRVSGRSLIPVTSGQARYEFDRLLGKVRKRCPERYVRLRNIREIELHPIFRMVRGPIEDWERLPSGSRGKAV